MDTIFVRQLRLQAWIGLHRHEKIAPQTIEIDLEIALPGDAVFKTRKVADTIDYGVVVEHVRALLAKERFGHDADDYRQHEQDDKRFHGQGYAVAKVTQRGLGLALR